MIYFLQLQKLGIATIFPVVGTKGYVVIAEVRDNRELRQLLLDNPMWPVEDYRVLAARPLSEPTSNGAANLEAPAGAQRFVVFARPSFPIPRRANVAKTRDLLREFAERDPRGLLYEIVEDAGFGFVAIGSAANHDELLRELFAVPLGNWGEFEVHALGSLEGEHQAVTLAGMVPAGSLVPVRQESRPPAPAARGNGVRRAEAGWGTARSLDDAALAALLGDPARPVTLVDVRTPEEFARGSIRGATLAPLDELNEWLDTWEVAPPPSLVFVCERGSRSLLAARAASRRGIDCASLDGGLTAWARSGRPLDVQGRAR